MDATFQYVLFSVVTLVLPLILAIAVHEYAHVAMARILGDRTGESMGRLTLNPLVHADPMWTVLLPTLMVVHQAVAGPGGLVPGLMAAGRPAPFRPENFDRVFFGRKVSMRLGTLLVAVAGPLSNILLALMSVGVLGVLLWSGSSWDDPRSLCYLVQHFIVLNVSIAVFNMIPIPPLDGSKVLVGILPARLALRYEEYSSRFSLLLFLLLVTFGGSLLGPIVSAVARAMLMIVA